MGIFWKCARVGERLSPYMSICCVVMAVRKPSSPPFLLDTLYFVLLDIG